MPPLLKKAVYGLGLVAGMILLSALVEGRLIPGVAIPPYPLRIVTLAGINIILAVSLNLINGFTGQFSIGHAGFMAIGAYGSAWMAVTFGKAVEGALGFLPVSGAQAAVVLVSCDPVAFARDARLLAGEGYRLAGCEVLDLFPQTHHVEVVSRFVKASSSGNT